MSFKLIKSLLIAGGVGFFILWILEYLRAGMLASYWLLLLSLMSLLFFQYLRLKRGIATNPITKNKPDKKNKIKRK